MCTLNVVAKGEESIASERYIRVFGNPFFLFFHRQNCWLLCKELLPDTVTQHVVMVFTDININRIITVGTMYSRLEWQVHHLRTLPQPPRISLVPG